MLLPLLKNKNGFSLIELLIVISIIAVLAAAAVGSFRVANQKSRNSRRQADVEQLRSALEIYRADNGVYYDVGGAGTCSTRSMGENGAGTCWSDMLDALGISSDLSDPYYEGQDKENPSYKYEYAGGHYVANPFAQGPDNAVDEGSYIICIKYEPNPTKRECTRSPVK